MKELKLNNEGIAYSGLGTENPSALYPGVCVMPDGRIIVTFRSASAREATEGIRVLMCISDDGGQSWSEAKAPFPDTPDVGGKRGQFTQMYVTPVSGTEALGCVMWVDASDTSRPYYNPETQGILDHILFFSLSGDAGENWPEPWIMEGLPHPRPTAPGAPVLCLPDGRLCCQYEVHKNHDEQGPVFFESRVAFSKDKGHTWHDEVVVNEATGGGKFFWDQRLNVIGDELLGLYWSYDDAKSEYINIHAAYSKADPPALPGYIWSPPYDTGVPGQPSAPVSLGDGSVAMAYIDRTGAPAIKVRRSFDGGRTWPGDTEITIFGTSLSRQANKKDSLNDMWVEMYRFSIGFPVASATPDGGMLVCFYAGEDTDHTVIRWAKLGF